MKRDKTGAVFSRGRPTFWSDMRGKITLTVQQYKALGRRIEQLELMLKMERRFIASQTVADRKTRR